MRKTLLFNCLLACTCYGQAQSSARVVYIKAGATGDGSSWENALGDIQQGIDLATNIEGEIKKEVWVAAGKFTLSKPIVLVENVNLYGGFNNESSVTDRIVSQSGNPWDFQYETVLDGNNSTRILESVNFTLETVVDGFTLTRGNGEKGSQLKAGMGGAAVVRNNVILQNSIVSHNACSDNGGAICMTGGKIKDCLFANNKGGTGGAVYMNIGDKEISHVEGCIFENNASIIKGGALNVQGKGTAYLNALIIRNNQAIDGTILKAGGAVNINAPTVFLSNSVIYNNSGLNSVYLNGGELLNTTIVNNIGGVYSASTSAHTRIINNVIWGCESSDKATGLTGASNTACIIKNNATFGSIAANKGYVLADNIELSSNKTNGDVLNPAEGTVGSGAKFNTVTSFIGVATTGEQLDELLLADWSIKETSPLIDRGLNIDEITNDIQGSVRNNRYDIGAYEFRDHSTTLDTKLSSVLKVIVAGKQIQLLNTLGMIEVYDMMGRLVLKSENPVFHLSQSGYYIIRNRQRSIKISVQ